MISVVVCSHNPRPQYLARVLSALERQSLPLSEWELLLIDNRSEPPLATRFSTDWHPRGRNVREDSLGLTHARLAGIRESTGDIVVFVDDDNVLDADYLEEVARTAKAHPFLGAWSGNVIPEFETQPEEWTHRYIGNLVIRTVTRDAWSTVYDLHDTTPVGAGLCLRREVAAEYLRLHAEGLRERVLDRSGGDLVSGGDNDLAACAIDIGLACGVVASHRLTHLIPPERLTEEYLLRLIEGMAYSAVILASFRPREVDEKHRTGLVSRVADGLRLMRMTSRERRFNAARVRGEASARRELGRA